MIDVVNKISSEGAAGDKSIACERSTDICITTKESAGRICALVNITAENRGRKDEEAKRNTMSTLKAQVL